MRPPSRSLARLSVRLSGLKYHDLWYKRTIRSVLRMSAERKRLLGIARTVRLIGNFPGLWQRTIEQTPDGSCQWGKTLFVAEGPADHYVILNSMHAPRHGERLLTEELPAPEHVWALHMEPEEYITLLGYDTGEEHECVSRFYTSSKQLLEKRGIYRPSPPYVHFNLGRSWDFLSTISCPKKPITLGIISSDLTDLEGHVERIRFLERLDASGIDYDLWGRGEGLKRFRNYRGFVQNKWQAHSRCKYSIVVENSVSPLYWSEKVADALLAYSLPLYYGCSQLNHFLPGNCVVPIDIKSMDVVDQIRHIIAGDEFERRFEPMVEARNLLLRKENLYAFIDRELGFG